MKRRLIRIGAVLAAIPLLLAIYVGYVAWRAHVDVPDWEGEISVAGLDGPIEIVRDANGVPHVFAATERDAIFAHGFIHAQDRFWQMALTRQAMAGRLSEWFGASTLRADRISRRSAGTALADRLWADFPAEEKVFLQAYAAGVNAWMESEDYRLPPEMRILHVEPERWQPRDSFLVLRSMYNTLARWGVEPQRARVPMHAASPVALEWAEGVERVTTPIIAPPGGGRVLQRSQAAPDGEFSNSWAVSGDFTASGLPLLANDPHLPGTTPNFWYLAHLAIGERHLVGATIPGIPGLVLGHNGKIAWGLTNTEADVNDIALVERDGADPRRFRRGPDASWERFASRREIIRVRFSESMEDKVQSSATGVIIDTELLSLPFASDPDILAEYRYHGHDRDQGLAAVLRLGRAATAAEGIAALEAFEGPPLNITLADSAGTIAYVFAGMIPVRPEAHARRVAQGPEDGNAYTRLPYADNPRVVNPESGRIVTANQQVIGPEYKYYLGDSWAEPSRANRIHEALDAREKHDVASFHAMQRDTLSPSARRLAPLLLAAKPASAADARFAAHLKGWDYRFGLDAHAPTVYLVWAAMAERRIGADELAGLPADYAMGNRFLAEILEGDYPHWCDDITTRPRESCPAMLTAALTDARLAVEKAYGPDPAGWRWGKVSTARLSHLGFADLPVLGDLFSRDVSLAAGPEAMFQSEVSVDPEGRFARIGFTSSLQTIFDLAAPERSRFMMAGGQSGWLGSPYFANLTPRWARGERFAIPMDRAAMEPVAVLRLSPR